MSYKEKGRHIKRNVPTFFGKRYSSATASTEVMMIGILSPYYILIDDQSGETGEDNHDDGMDAVKTGADEGKEEDEQARDELERAF